MSFFFNDTATTEIYTLALHDALPICNLELRRISNGQGAREIQALIARTARAVHNRDGDRTRRRQHERSEEHTSELQSRQYLVCRLLLEKTTIQNTNTCITCTPQLSSH